MALVKGVKWALAANDFSFTNIADDKTPVVEFLISAATGAVRGRLIKGQAILVNGSTFGNDAEGVSARFENDTEEVDGSFWNHDVELTLYFADGGSATKTVRFVQL